MQKITARRSPQLAYATGGSSPITLPNVDRWHRIWITFNGNAQVVMGAGTAVWANTGRAPYSAIKLLTLTLTGYRSLGSMTLFQLTGYQAAVWMQVENPSFSDRSTPAYGSGAALVNGANAFNFQLMLPISVGEVDFTGMLPLGGELSAQFQLQIDWAAADTDVVTVAGGATVVVTGTAYVKSETFQFLQGEPEKLGLREDMIHQLTKKTTTVAATGDNRIALSTGVLHLRIVNLLRNNTAYANGTFDNFDLVVEDTVRPFTIREDEWRDEQRYRSQDRDLPAGTYALDRYWTRTWRDVYDALKLTRFEQSFNVITAPAGTTDVDTIQEVAIPTPQAAKKAA